MKIDTYFYRGSKIEITAAGHPQAQDITIDGKPSGFVTFPSNARDAAKATVDLRIHNEKMSQSLLRYY